MKMCNRILVAAILFFSTANVTHAQPGAALNFDGINDYCNISNNANIPGSGPVSVEAWIKYTAGSGNLCWFKKGTTNGYGLYVLNNTIYVITYGQINWNTNVTVTPETWTHITFTFDGTTLRIYKDGLLAGSLNAGYNAATASAYVGYNPTGFEAGYFKGSIDELRVWNRALSACEIQANMNCEVNAANQAGLALLYHFNQGVTGANNNSINSVTDSGPYNLEGILTNFTLTGAVSNWVSPGSITSGNYCSAPVISITSGSNPLCTVAPVSFTVTGYDISATPSFQWKKNGINTGINSNIYTDAALANGDVISCVVTTSGPCISIAVSNSIIMNVGFVTPVIYISATANNICTGTAVTFTAYYTQNGGANPAYQWFKNNVPIPGATSTTYISSTWANNDSISCLLTSNNPCATPTTVGYENKIGITVNPLPLPILTNPGNSTCLSNSSLSLSGADLSFIIDWYNNGTLFKSDRLAKIVAGGVSPGSTAGLLNTALSIYVDVSGNVYVSDYNNYRVQKWAPGLTTGITVAGGNGYGTAANQLASPLAIFVDLSGNVFVVDNITHRVQKWAPGATTGITVAGGNGSGAAANQLNSPSGIFVDPAGNIYISDANNFRIQKWAPGATAGITVAGGNGNGSAANQFNNQGNIWVDIAGNIYVSDGSNHRVQKWAPGATTGITVAGGNGNGSAPNQLSFPKGVCMDGNGNLYISDNKARIQKWAPGATAGITVAGGLNGSDVKGACVFVNDAGTKIYTTNYINIQEWAQPPVYPATTYQPTVAGSYNAVVTNLYGCTGTSNIISISNIGTGSTFPDETKNPHLVRDIALCPSSGSNPVDLVMAGSKIFFTADSSGGTKKTLWMSDGTQAGTKAITMINQLNTGITAASAEKLTVTSSKKVFFREKIANNYAGNLWVTDSTGNTMLLDAHTPSHYPLGGNNFNFLLAIGNEVFYNMETTDGHWQLRKSDGTPAGTILVKDFGLADNMGGIILGTVLNNKLYFDFYNTPASFEDEIWVSDGTTAGTNKIFGLGNRGLCSYLMPSGNYIYFESTGGSAIELWKTDGTTIGTTRVTTLDNLSNKNYYTDFLSTNDQLIISLYDNLNGKELWVSGGDSLSTFMVKDINIGNANSNLANFTLVSNKLFYTAYDGINGKELWTSPFPVTKDSAKLVKDLNPGASDGAGATTNINGKLYFSGNDGITGFELWTTDSSDASTVLVADINPGSAGSDPDFIKNFNALPNYLVAIENVTGRELYKFNKIDKFWNGSINNLWSNANNWNPVGIPDISDNVLVPNLPQNDIIFVDIDAFCNFLWVNPGAGVQVLSGNNLLIQGH